MVSFHAKSGNSYSSDLNPLRFFKVKNCDSKHMVLGCESDFLVADRPLKQTLVIDNIIDKRIVFDVVPRG